MPTLRAVFFGPDGLLRPFLRAIVYLAVGMWAIVPLLDRLFGPLTQRFHANGGLTPLNTFLGELELFVAAAIVTGLLAIYERRRIDSYGLPIARAFRGTFWEGLAVGIVWPALVALGMIALGGMQVQGVALHGATLLTATLAWAGANVTVGIAEEFWYRSYLLQTLWKSVGFWPAAALIALLFASDHYFYKTGENLYDVVSLVAFNMLACYTVLRTGTLWFAVGMHAAFDFMQLFVIGTPNGSLVPADRLLNVTFDGPAWLTGGVLGTEASILMYPLFVLVFLYVTLRFRSEPQMRPASERVPVARPMR